MKKIIYAACLLSTSLYMAPSFSDVSNCNVWTDAWSGSYAETTISCLESSTHQTRAYTRTFWGSWKKLNTSTKTGVRTYHTNVLWGVPLRHRCKVSAYAKDFNGTYQYLSKAEGFCI